MSETLHNDPIDIQSSTGNFYEDLSTEFRNNIIPPVQIILKEPAEVSSNTGLDTKNLSDLDIIDKANQPKLVPLKTIEWRLRFNKSDPLYAEYSRRDERQTTRLEKIYKNTATFDDIKNWYLDIGAEYTLFEQTKNKDTALSEAMRAYLVHGAYKVISQLESPDNNEFQVIGGTDPVMKDKRILAANMLHEAIMISFINETDSDEIDKLIRISFFLYRQVEATGNSSAKEDALAHMRDLLAFQMYRFGEGKTDEDKDEKDRAQKIKKQKNYSLALLDLAEKNNDPGATSEATIGLILDRAIERGHAHSDLLYRKSFLREDMGFDGYTRNGLKKKAFDGLVYIAHLDPLTYERITNEFVPIQIKTKYDPGQSGIYSEEVMKISISEYDMRDDGHWLPLRERLRSLIRTEPKLAIENFFGGKEFQNGQGKKIKDLLDVSFY